MKAAFGGFEEYTEVKTLAIPSIGPGLGHATRKRQPVSSDVRKSKDVKRTVWCVFGAFLLALRRPVERTSGHDSGYAHSNAYLSLIIQDCFVIGKIIRWTCQRRRKIRPKGGVKPGQLAPQAGTVGRA